MKIVKVFFALYSTLLLILSAHAVEQSKSLELFKQIHADKNLYSQHFFDSNVEPVVEIHYTKFSQDKGPKGSIVIAPGRTESSLKFLETAYDLKKLGYSPIYILDHRGQGFSNRLLDDPQKGHIENFQDYVLDFNKFVQTIVLQDSNVDKENLFLITNSMGGAIAMRYLQKYSNNTFKKVALSGSMFKIKYPGFKEWQVRALGNAICLGILKKYKGQPVACNEFAPGEGPFDASKRSFQNNLDKKLYTHSPERFEMRDYLWNTYPALELGGATTSWALQAARSNVKIRKKWRAKKVKSEVLLLTASLDFRAEESAHKEVCQNLGAKKCVRLRYKDAFHELFMENDFYRNHVIHSIDLFFQSKSILEFSKLRFIEKHITDDHN